MLRPARYVDEAETVLFGQVAILRQPAREAMEFQRATGPLDGILPRLMDELRVDDEERRLRDEH